MDRVEVLEPGSDGRYGGLCPDGYVYNLEVAGTHTYRVADGIVAHNCQNLFGHARLGRQAAADAEFVIKVGPAFGVVLVLATQRPDRESLPTGISGNASVRFCLKVMGQVENDMVLGTGAYRNGIRATTFRPGTDAGIGYLSAAAMPQVVRTAYLDMNDAERVAVRARALRESAGTLSGAALGGEAEAPRDVLADLGAVFGPDAGLQWGEAAARLASRFPDRWAGATAEAVSAEARARGVSSVNVRSGGTTAKGCRAADVAGAS